MTSERQKASNQENSKLSTGPRTARGKAHSSANPIKHGAYAARVDIVSTTMLKEDFREVIALVEAVTNELSPTSVIEQAAARSHAMRVLGQARANQLMAALISGSAIPDEPVVPGTARYQVLRSQWITGAVALLRGDSDEDPEWVARRIHGQMQKEASLRLRHPGSFESRAPVTPEDWLKLLRGLIIREYGGVDEAESIALGLYQRFHPEASREHANRRGREARQILGAMREATDLLERTDRLADRSHRDYFQLQKRMSDSTSKLLLDGTTGGEIVDDEPYDADDDEVALDAIDSDATDDHPIQP